jgi:hypothetical protein
MTKSWGAESFTYKGLHANSFFTIPPWGYGSCIKKKKRRRNEGAIMPRRTSEL